MKKLYIILLSLGSVGSQAQNFTKITNSKVVEDGGDSRSVNWIDINSDGHLDLMISNGLKAGENNFLYLNNGAGGFIKMDSSSALVNDQSPSVGVTWADIDNDGDNDCYVTTWYLKKNYLYRNDGVAGFKQIMNGSIANDVGYSETASFADYDLDGKLDLYVSNSDGVKRNFLYKGNGDTTFTKINVGSLVTDAKYSRSVIWSDIDLDHDLDLLVSNEFNQSEDLYLNQGQGNFTKANTAGISNSNGNTMSQNVVDFDNDGDLDILNVNYEGPILLLKNQGINGYQIDTLRADQNFSFGSNWGDIDNDGDLDLYITNAFAPSAVKNQLYFNNGMGQMIQTFDHILVADSGWSYGCAFGDYNRDGQLDLAVANCFNANQHNSLYQNQGNSNNWVAFELEGTQSNRSAIGAKLYLYSKSDMGALQQMREVNSQSGYCGQNMYAQHFGLSQNGQIDSLVVTWPSSQKTSYPNVNVNSYHRLVEPMTVGIKDEKKSEIKIINDENGVELRWIGQQYMHVKLFNMNGELLIDEETDGDHLKLQTAGMATGIYLLRVEFDGIHAEYKILVP